MAAVWFFRVFRGEHTFAAGTIAGFGLVNAVGMLMATAFSASALAVAGDPSLAPGADQAATVQLRYLLGDTTGQVSGLFFGLWLVPMGYVVLVSRLMPARTGWILIAGGVGYVINTYITQVTPDAPAVVEGLLVGTATVGEFWLIGYLLVFGVRAGGATRAPVVAGR